MGQVRSECGVKFFFQFTLGWSGHDLHVFNDPKQVSYRRDDSRSVHWMDFMWNCLRLINSICIVPTRTNGYYQANIRKNGLCKDELPGLQGWYWFCSFNVYLFFSWVMYFSKCRWEQAEGPPSRNTRARILVNVGGEVSLCCSSLSQGQGHKFRNSGHGSVPQWALRNQTGLRVLPKQLGEGANWGNMAS